MRTASATFCCLVVAACTGTTPAPSADPSWNRLAPGCPADPDPTAATTGFEPVRVWFAPSQGRTVRFDGHVARSDTAQARGWMYRQAIPLSDALVFPNDPPQVNRFWMHDTCVPLDLVFAAADGTVLGVITAPAMDDTPRGIEAPSSFVVELGSGVAAANGITAGARMRLDPPLPPIR